MPDSHFVGSFKGKGDYDEMGDAWTAFLGGGVSGVTLGESHLDLVTPIAAPSASGLGYGYDVTIDIPNFSKQPGVTYQLNYSIDGFVNFSSVGYDVEPGVPIVHPGGYIPGQQYSIFGNECPGEPSTALA